MRRRSLSRRRFCLSYLLGGPCQCRHNLLLWHRRHLRGLQAGQTVALQILRGGALRDLSVAAGAA